SHRDKIGKPSRGDIGKTLMTRGVFRGTAALAAAALLASCAVGPDFAPPPAPNVPGYTPERLGPTTAAAATAGGEAQRFVKDLDLPGQWWTLFHSKPLNALVEQALASNQDLKAAQAALRVARENVRAQQGQLWPQVDGNASAFRGLPPIGAPLDNSFQAPTFNLFTTQLSISYVPDVFGGTQRSIEALVAQKDQQRFQLEATYLTLTSNLAGAAVQEAALAQFEQTLPPLQKQLAQVRNLLAALAGGFPSDRLPMRFELAGLRLPHNLPVSIPAKLIEQRPDVRMAEEALHAASAQIGVTIAARLPNITLTANAGSTSDAIRTMFGSGTEFWTVTGAVAQPIFHGGTLFHQELAAKAAFDEAQAQYRSTVITAFQNVADALRAIRSDAVALQKAVAAERAASHSLDIVRGRLKLGDVNYLALLNAQQTYQQAVLSLAQARAARYADTVALFQALGGGWWNRQDVEPEKPTTLKDFF